jgi:threonine synthase
MIKKIPKILGVQASGCDPFYQAFINDRALEETDEFTIADSIAVGIPRNPVKGLNAVKKSNGTYVVVSDEEIMAAMKTLAETEGIFAEPAASASFAGFIKARSEDLIKEEETVTVIITGNGLKDTKNALTILEEPVLLEDNLEELIRYFKKEKRG